MIYNLLFTNKLLFRCRQSLFGIVMLFFIIYPKNVLSKGSVGGNDIQIIHNG